MAGQAQAAAVPRRRWDLGLSVGTLAGSGAACSDFGPLPRAVCRATPAETEKYAHVTFFFNGGTEKEYALEHRKMVPSPKVATYDLQPAMSALAVADEVGGSSSRV